MPIGTEKNTLFAAAGVSSGNYFGSGADGDHTTSGSENLTVLNGNGSFDGDMVVKNYGDYTISAGHTVTTSQSCRGLLIYVKGDCVINGTLSMNGRGANADPTATTNWNAAGSDGNIVNANGLRLPMFTASGSSTLSAADFAGCGTAAVTAVGKQPGIDGDGTIFQIIRQGANGGGGGSGNPGPGAGGDGTAGGGTTTDTYQTGGGGGGEGGSDGNGPGTGGSGGYGSCWTGGSGGGGAFRTGPAGGGGAWGGGGGSGASQNNNNGCGSGGAGNPGGNGVGYCPGYTGASGTGGLLILIVKGDLTVGNAGLITAQGVRAGSSGGGRKPGGGSSGGGVILILHGGTKTYTGGGTWSTAGGTRGAGWGSGGGAGGNGDVSDQGGIAVTVG